MEIGITDVIPTQIRGYWENDTGTSEEEVIKAVSKYLCDETPLKFDKEYIHVPDVNGRSLDDDIRSKGEWICDVLP